MRPQPWMLVASCLGAWCAPGCGGGAPDAPGAWVAGKSDSPQARARDDFEAFALGETWLDSSAHGAWRSVFNGHGTVGIALDGTQVLMQRPQASTEPAETHAGLVVSTQPFANLDLSVRLRTVEQLRTPTPNPWEVAWVVWHYSDNTHFYYLVLKPNGWELGKEDPVYPGAQRNLATGSSPTFVVGANYAVRVVQVGASITAYVDGAELVSFTDLERTYVGGSVGLYNEDAEAHFDDVVVTDPTP